MVPALFRAALRETVSVLHRRVDFALVWAAWWLGSRGWRPLRLHLGYHSAQEPCLRVECVKG